MGDVTNEMIHSKEISACKNEEKVNCEEQRPNDNEIEKEHSDEKKVSATPTLSAEERRLLKIRNQTEEAKDPSTYETYEQQAVDEANISLFMARRRGSVHIRRKMPCQDYCLTKVVKGNIILADSDGISACIHSDVGSRLACEAVFKTVEAASASCDSEEQLINRLMSVSFREKLVQYWIAMVREEIYKSGKDPGCDFVQELSTYGSTIMFAVITKNWIVTGNLGDGQIIVFNDSYGIKLRDHAPKESSKVRSLVNPRCAREDFQVAKYPRRYFNSVMLSTDGIYESFERGNMYYQYALQAKQRFLSRNPAEPYQAFCFKEKNEPYKDFSQMRTQDDCSIVLAIDENSVETDYDLIIGSILSHSGAQLLRRWSEECLLFYVLGTGTLAEVLVTKSAADMTIKKFVFAELEEPVEVWMEKGYYFSWYEIGENTQTLESMHANGMLRPDWHNRSESEQRILKVYTLVRNLSLELDKAGYELNSSAIFNISFNGEKLFLKREAIRRKSRETASDLPMNLQRLFSHLLGVLQIANLRYPVFVTGYVVSGLKYYYRMGTEGELAQIVWDQGENKLKNISKFSWKIDANNTVLPGEIVRLQNPLRFIIVDEENAEQFTCNYIPKEYL